MQINKLVLENFRCFEHLELDLHPRINVFVGVNGSGKTAILEAIKYVVIGALGQIKRAVPKMTEKEGYAFLEKKDPRIERFGLGEFTQSNTVKITGNMELGHEKFHFSREMTLANVKYARKNDYEEGANVYRHINDSLQENEEVELPLFAYHSTGRLFQEDKPTKTDLNGARINGYLNAQTAKSSQHFFKIWFDKRERGKERYKKWNIEFDFSSFEKAKEMICAFIPNCKAIEYDDLKFNEIILIFDNGDIIPYSMLSDGLRNLLGLVSDLAWRAATLNPWMGDRINELHGVVLIDEVDLHLHPSWQRMVVPRLLAAFPNVQFFITTHSPQVLSSISEENLFIIKDFNIQTGQFFTEGRDSNAILQDVFDLSKRPQEEQSMLNQFYQFLEIKQQQQALEILEKLEKKWGSLDPEIVRANLYYQDLLDEIHS
jgi:predicted ATP-binding protein involved in virulence